MAEKKNNRLPRTPYWEDAAIIISIFTLWPTIFHMETVFSRVLMMAAIFVLLWIMVRRLKRVNSISK